MAASPRKAFLLRLDLRVYEELQRLAAAELRSVNGQIEYLIREALRERGRTSGGPAVEKADAMPHGRKRSETQRGG